jgi:hypothetical protein
MIKELTFPKLDAQDKNACYMNITLAVEDIAFAKGSGNKIPPQAKNFDIQQKHWTANNFHFFLDDKKFENACSRVLKVDSFTIKQNIIEHHMGGFKAAIKTPSSIEFPNLTFYVPEADAQPFMDHMAQRVGFGEMGRGEVRDAATLNGHIEAYNNELQPIFDLQFYGADIVSVTPDRSDATSEELKLVKVELFTEKMKFTYKQD